MLRYFYINIITFIIIILSCEWAFCYNYIDDSLGTRLYKSGRHMRKFKKAGETKNRRTLRQNFDSDRYPVEFDVASFIQSGDDEADDEMFRSGNNKRQNKGISNVDYRNINSLNADDVRIKDNGIDYLGMQEDNIPKNRKLTLEEPINNNKMNMAFYKEKRLNTLNDVELASPRLALVHNPEKKCIFKNMKIPFFFHNKTENAIKKNKKRRFFNLNTSKGKKRTKSTLQVEDSKAREKIKRSYAERVCPSCRRRYIVDMPRVRTQRATIEPADDKAENFILNNKGRLKPEFEESLFEKDEEKKEVHKGDRIKREEMLNEYAKDEIDDIRNRIDDVPDFYEPDMRQATRVH